MIEPTLGLEQASQRIWDVLVVGAGPAGSLAAAELACRGASVLLVDRSPFPRAKVCGCCLNNRALAVLARVGLTDCTRTGVHLHTLTLGSGPCTAQLPLSGNVAISRSAFDASLVRSAIRRGAEFLPSTLASLGPVSEEKHSVFLQGNSRQQAQATARIVLAADGLGGGLLDQAGLGETRVQPGSRIGAGVVIESRESFYAPGVLFMACGQAGYVGLVRLEDGRLDLATALDTGPLRRVHGPAGVVRELLAGVGWPIPEGLGDLPWRGTLPLTRRATGIAGHRLFALGDATGYVEPFTGEGMAWALASAVALVPLVVRSLRQWKCGFAHEWATLHRRIVTDRQIACSVLAAVLRRPWLTTAMVGLLARMPTVAGPVLRSLNHS